MQLSSRPVLLALIVLIVGCGRDDSARPTAADLIPRAEAGDPAAQFDLAQRLERGDGVVQDLVSAHAYYNLAAAQGNDAAREARDRLTPQMSPEEAAEARKLALSWKPTAPGAEGDAEAAPSQAPATPEALLAAAHTGDVGTVKSLLDQGVDPNQPDAQGWTALLVAAMGGHVEMVQLLLGNGADVNARSPDGATPLHAAIAGGKAVVVEELLKAGADREAAANGVTPVMLAQQSQDPQIRELVGAATPPQPAAPAPPKITPMDAPYAALGAANVRRGPEKEFPAVAKLSQGEVVKVTGRVESNGWLQVLTSAGTVGYVHPSLVATEAEARTRLAEQQSSPHGRAGGATAGMVRVPAGEFFMGCNEQVDSECSGDEKPGRVVSVSVFSIDRTEVTVAAYRECVNAGACTEPDGGNWGNWAESGREQHPVNYVDWNQATAYCRWKGRRLPTEEEWEKAARGTDGRKYPWGNGVPSCDKANLKGCGSGGTSAVEGRIAGASPYGALDMSGNVRELVNDSRSVRGGSWAFVRGFVRASSRNSNASGIRSADIGFRCAQ